MSHICDICEEKLPLGCRHFYGGQEGCEVGPCTDLVWVVGMKIYDNLADRRGIKWELEKVDLEIKVEIIKTLGTLAVETVRNGQ